jgi:hypothetical protein
MNAQEERGSDSENFGARIAEIGVTVVKIWRKEVAGIFCNFWKVARGIFGNTLKTRGLLRIFVDYGLTTKKPSGFIAKWRGFSSSGFIL